MFVVKIIINIILICGTYLQLNPKGIRQQLAWIKREYGDIEILITENGFASANHGINDQDRVQYFKDHLEQVIH